MTALASETDVACPACGAEVGERCVAPSGYRYYVGYGHVARGEALVAARASHNGSCPTQETRQDG